MVVGGTGFLGKVWVSMFLHHFDELEHIYLMVRAKAGRTPESRFWAEIAASETFEPLRERYPGAEFEEYLKRKVTPIAGDVTKSLLGIDPDLVTKLEGQIAAVVNVAGVVDFNPPLDEALQVNAFGVNNLIDLARRLDCAVMHTSTCYVAGYRTGFIEEVDPRSVPFPRAEGAPGERLIAPPDHLAVDQVLDRSHWSPENEVRESLDVIDHVRHRCDDAFRQSLFLDEAKRNLVKRGEPARGAVLEDELTKVKRKFTRKQLIDAGMERALYWGWPNIYTYTKSIGEQLLAASGVTYAIVRPAVVESASQYPFPGWNEGINTSAPFIYMAMQGQVQIPNDHDVHLDIVTVDMVASGMIAALAELVEGTHRPMYQFGGTDTNPCRMSRFLELIGLYKRQKLQDGGSEGNPVLNAIIARIEPINLSKKQYERHGAHAIAKAARGFASVLKRVGIGPAASVMRPAAKALERAAKREDKMGDIMDLFMPFTAECDWIFSCANTRAALDRMPPEERARFFWEPENIDWRWWMYNVHLPGIEKWAFPLFEERLKKSVKPLRRHANLLDLMDEMAERHQHALALRFLEDEGFSRWTYLELRDAAVSTAARLHQAGVRPGDRVLLSGENRPAWPIAYFGILRAGAVAVPLDPKLTETQLATIAKSAKANVALLGAEVSFAQIAREDSSLQVLDLDEATNAATEPMDAPDVTISGTDLASIIFTSGTTGDPKGVMLSHDNFCGLLAGITPLFPLTERDTVLSVLPLHHTFEFACGLLLPLSRGAGIGYIGELTAERLGRGIGEGRISAMVGVPALWQMLERRLLSQVAERGPIAATAFDWALELNRLLGRNLGVDAGKFMFGAVHQKLGGRMRYLISGGGALPKKTADVFAGLGLHLSEGYGLTEASPVLTVAAAGPRNRPGQVGKPIPGVEVTINAANDEGIGEVFARGPNVMRGYFGNEDATKQAIDDDGWLHTGDLGRLDKKGRLVLSGRSKDVIVSTSGENVYPDDVEELLGRVSGISELCIVGVQRGDTEVVGCIAVPTASDPLENGDDRGSDRFALRREARRSLSDAYRKLPSHCRPAITQIYDVDLPKTATRKIKRAEAAKILERLMATADAGEASSGATGGDLVKQSIATIAGVAAATLKDQTMLVADLGFDSLMSMELSAALENQLARSLDQETLNQVETVGDLVRVCAASSAQDLTSTIETTEDESIQLPSVVAAGAKSLLGSAQMAFYGSVMKPRVYGRAHIPHNRNTIVVSNHASHLDMGFVKYALGEYGEEVVSLAAQDYFFEGRWKRTYFEQLTNLQAFDRKTNLRSALRQSADTLRSGKTVVLFPEGTRSTDGVVHEFKSTLGHLALSTSTDVLPVALVGTYESWPKGRRIPTRRDITAHIGPPLRIEDIERLTADLKFAKSCKAVAHLARAAVVALKRGSVLDLSQYESLAEALGEQTTHPLVTLFGDLEKRFVVGAVDRPITFYFSLGTEKEAKWTAVISPENVEIHPGKPAGQNADCVLKTTPDIFSKMVKESYTPTAVEVMSGLVKSNDVSLLAAFQQAFDLSNAQNL